MKSLLGLWLLSATALTAADDLSLVQVPAGRYDIGSDNAIGAAGGREAAGVSQLLRPVGLRDRSIRSHRIAA